MGSWNQRIFLFFFHMDIHHNENTASCLEWIFEPISKISWLHLCISISRLTILFPVVMHVFSYTASVWLLHKAVSVECYLSNFIHSQLYQKTPLPLYFFYKTSPTDTCNFFKSTHEFENWHISYFDIPVHEYYNSCLGSCRSYLISSDY